MSTQQTQKTAVPEWTLGDRLRKAREAAGLNQGQLADIIGVCRQTVNNSERGRNRPMQTVYKAWSVACGVSVEWLLTGEEPAPAWSGEERRKGPVDRRFWPVDHRVRHKGIEPLTRWFDASNAPTDILALLPRNPKTVTQRAA